MKKKLISILLIFGLVFVFSACSSDNSDLYQDDEQYGIEDGTNMDSEMDNNSENVGIELLRQDPTDDSDYGFFLLRDGVNYTLSELVDDESAPDGIRVLYDNIVDINSSGLKGFHSIGDVPMPVLQDDDLIVCYSDDRVPTLGLNQVDFYGYSIGVIHYPKDSAMYYYDTSTGERIDNKNVSDLTVTDSEGDVVEDIHKLDENQNCIVSWYEGTQYKEISLDADSKMYIIHNSEYDKDYEIEGSLTKNGYAEYNLSDIPAGTYKISTGPGGGVWQGLITVE